MIAKGFILSETLVAFSLLGIGIVLFQQTQSLSTEHLRQTRYYLHALQIARDISARMSLNPVANQQQNYEGEWKNTDITCTNATQPCTAAMMAAFDQHEVLTYAHQVLPQPQITVQPCEAFYCIKVQWESYQDTLEDQQLSAQLRMVPPRY